MARYIKCIDCGIFNKNRVYCTNCGAILSYKKRRKIAYEKAEKARIERELEEEKNNPSFFEKYRNHKYAIVRIPVMILYSIWLGFIAIVTFIAWLITAIAA